MARKCKVCVHPELNEINRELAAQSPNISEISRKYGIPWDSLKRHKVNHLPKSLSKAKEAQDIALGDDLLNQVKLLQTKSFRILRKAEDEGDLRIALAAIKEARGNLELLAKLLGQIEERREVQLQFIIPIIAGIISQEIKDTSTVERIIYRLNGEVN